MKNRKLGVKKGEKNEKKLNKNLVKRLQLNLKNHLNYWRTFSVYPVRYLGLFNDQSGLLQVLQSLLHVQEKKYLEVEKEKKRSTETAM